MSTVKVINVIHPSGSTNNIVNDSSGNITVGGTAVMGSSFLRNRIINGDMRIDQRNAGAAVTTPTDGQFIIDRFLISVSVSGKVSVGQNYNSATTQAGFPNYLGAASISAYSVATNDLFSWQQRIEGFNVSDLAWGSASAKTVTLSFYVYSSLTGTFGGSVQNSAQDRSYPFTYTISSANTWEQKTITIPGPTSGTWLTTNGNGINLYWTIGAGTGRQGAAGSWASANYQAATGATSILGTNGATLYITGCQFEQGSVATSFERRQYEQELALCQRYYERCGCGAVGAAYSTTYANMGFCYNTTKRGTPTMALTTTAPVVSHWGIGDKTASGATITGSNIGVSGAFIQINGFSGLTGGTGLNLSTDQCIALSAEI